MSKEPLVVVLAALMMLIGQSGCTREDDEHARRKLREAGQELKHDTHVATEKLKQGAHEAGQELRHDANQASREIKKGSEKLKHELK